MFVYVVDVTSSLNISDINIYELHNCVHTFVMLMLVFVEQSSHNSNNSLLNAP